MARRRHGRNTAPTPPRESHPARTELSAAKKRLFTIVLLLFPFLLVALVELTLRFSNYGGNLDLVIRKSINGREFYSINRDVARRYFIQQGTVIPEPTDDTFSVTKTKNTKRIFCLGESTMAGFPYEFNATAPGFLRERLETLLDNYTVEVVNVGLSAVGSYVVNDFIDELVEYEPDLFIVYLGHNEFYGVYGVGSSVTIPGGAWLTRLTISLLKFKTFLLLRDSYSWLRQAVSSDDGKRDASLMQNMVGNQTIVYGSDAYEKARIIYQENLESSIRIARAHNIPVLFGTLVSNIRTQTPFQGVFADATSEEVKNNWHSLMTQGDQLMSAGNLEPAIMAFRDATLLDSLNAVAFHKLGTALYSAGSFVEAKKALTRAKDLDALRFRASEDFKSTLLDVCRIERAFVAYVDSSFESSSPHGIIGSELMLEHLHPNLRGYSLMARSFLEAIVSNNLLVDKREWNWSNDKSDDGYLESSGATEFDSIVGKIKVELLTQRWPFTAINNPPRYVPTIFADSIAYLYVKGSIYWSAARYRLADYYVSRKEFAKARAECLALSKVARHSYEPLLRIADYYNMEGKTEEAVTFYKKSIRTEDNPFARLKLAVILLAEEKPLVAASHIDSALALHAAGKHTLAPDARAWAYYLLGGSQVNSGKLQEALQSLSHALALKPDFVDARELYRQVQQAMPRQ